jgi:hypothetical protein
MKRTFPILLVFISFLLFPVSIYPQVVIHNPAIPPAKDFGRIVQLKEVLRIKDDGKDVSFRAPYDLMTGYNGEILFYDNFVLYVFDRDGRRLAAMVRSGQGPGEASMRTSAVLAGENIHVLALSPPKIMVFDGIGRLQKEMKTEALSNYGFFSLGAKSWVFRIPRVNPESIPMTGGEIDMPISLEGFESDFGRTIKVAEFPRRYYFVNRGIWYEWSGFGCAVREPDHLYIHHTSEYRIVEFDTTSKKTEKIFSREYSRVKRPNETREAGPGIKLPPRIYYDDILALFVVGDHLWVVTSTVDSKQNRLVDVFDSNGRYVDNFYLQFPDGHTRRIYPGRIAIDGDIVYTIDEDTEGFMSIGKYSIAR